MYLKIATPKKVAYEQEVESITAPGESGEITILPHHASLLSLLGNGVITIKTKKDEEYLAIGGGYLETDGKEVHILVSRAYNQDDIDEKFTTEAIAKARKVLDATEDRRERQEAASLLRRSVVDLKLLSKIRRKKKS